MISPSKHAYLIIAHSNLYVLQRLVSLLDDERNDIYIHVDKKTEDIDFKTIYGYVKKSKLTFIERLNVYWGHVSQIEVELKLLRAAFEQGGYNYYHLISGSDLPVKSQDEIHAFFSERNGKQFIGFSDDKLDIEKVNKIHLFPKYQRLDEKAYWKRLARKTSKLFLAFQRQINYSISWTESLKFVHGANWMSITSELVSELLRNEKKLLKAYRYSSCADEIYVQTFVYNSDFKASVFDMSDELNSCQHFMDWKRGRPYTFREEDYDLLMSSGLMFARKFEDVVDKKIVDRVFKEVDSRSC